MMVMMVKKKKRTTIVQPPEENFKRKLFLLFPFGRSIKQANNRMKRNNSAQPSTLCLRLLQYLTIYIK
jgi:hypothetical protein